MGPIGFQEMVFILVLAILIFGPKRLPEIGRTLGKGMSEFRKASNELKRTLNAELALDETPTPPALRPYRLETPAESAPRVSAEIPEISEMPEGASSAPAVESPSWVEAEAAASEPAPPAAVPTHPIDPH